MSIHPQFFDSEQEFVTEMVQKWELENPHPTVAFPTRPKVQHQVLLIHNGGSIVVDPYSTHDVVLTVAIENDEAQIILNFGELKQLVNALQQTQSQVKKSVHWATNSMGAERNQQRKYQQWLKERAEIVAKAQEFYQHAQSTQKSKSGANSPQSVTYSVICRKNYDGEICYAVCASYPNYKNGTPIEVGGSERWAFWTSEAAYQDAERRARRDNEQGKVATVDYNNDFGGHHG